MFKNNRLNYAFLGLALIFVLISMADLIYDLIQYGFQWLEVLEFGLIVSVSFTLVLLWVQLYRRYKVEQKTVQNHATSIYNKSKTLGRSDLAAFFLCDIFEED